MRLGSQELGPAGPGSSGRGIETGTLRIFSDSGGADLGAGGGRVRRGGVGSPRLGFSVAGGRRGRRGRRGAAVAGRRGSGVGFQKSARACDLRGSAPQSDRA